MRPVFALLLATLLVAPTACKNDDNPTPSKDANADAARDAPAGSDAKGADGVGAGDLSGEGGVCANVQCPAATCQIDPASQTCSSTRYDCSQASGKCEAIPYSIALSCVEDASAKRCSQSRGLCPPDKSCTAKSETYSDAYCDQATGLCKPITPKTCTVDCDCDQGQLCHFGSCLTGFLPVYCCTKSGCEKNKRCTDSSGKASACPGSNPCVFAAGTCVLQGDPCPIGYSKSSSVKCGDALPVDCCTPNSP